jgi:hypothetical protein
LKYYAPKSFEAQNIIEPYELRKYPFQRFPEKYKNRIRKEVWNLSENNAGISIQLKTNSKILKLKWAVKLDFRMNHMTDAGIKGLDIYQCEDRKWKYLSTGLPNSSKNKHTIKFKNVNDKILCFYLPLYDSIVDFKIGVDDESNLKFLKTNNKPIVFYGTSITQGGCASRPGMAHTNIISRNTIYQCINLGFSGNGHLEAEIGNILSKIDAKCFIIDCLPNVNISQIRSNTLPLIQSIRGIDKIYHCPIFFLEQPLIHDQYIDEDVKEKNYVLASQIKECNKLGFKDIYLIEQKDCLGSDYEATVDGVHYNDIGFQRFSDHILKNIVSIL